MGFGNKFVGQMKGFGQKFVGSMTGFGHKLSSGIQQASNWVQDKTNQATNAINKIEKVVGANPVTGVLKDAVNIGGTVASGLGRLAVGDFKGAADAGKQVLSSGKDVIGQATKVAGLMI